MRFGLFGSAQSSAANLGAGLGQGFHDYIDYYAPDYRLHIAPSNMENLNSREYLEKCCSRIIDNLRHLSGAPSVQLGTDVPPDALHSENDDDDEQDPDDA